MQPRRSGRKGVWSAPGVWSVIRCSDFTRDSWQHWGFPFSETFRLFGPHGSYRGFPQTSWRSCPQRFRANPLSVLETVSKAVSTAWHFPKWTHKVMFISVPPSLCARRRGSNVQEEGGFTDEFSVSSGLWGKSCTKWTAGDCEFCGHPYEFSAERTSN